MRTPMHHVTRFLAREDGGITVFSLFFLLAALVITGLALDVSNAVQQRTHLQTAADSAAHAAVVTRNKPRVTAETAKTVALGLAAKNMPASAFGEVLKIQDISFGTWDSDAASFTADEDARDAVLVSTRRASRNENALGTFLLKLVGLNSWNLARDAVFVSFDPPCFREGFVAEEMVDLQSNNTYKDGFCIHSNDLVSLNSNNYFESGTVVSMPDLADIDLPKSGFETNEGLEAALRYGKYHIKIIAQLPQIIEDLKNPTNVRDPESIVYRDYITSSTVKKLSVVKGVGKLGEGQIAGKLAAENITAGQIHLVTCAQTGNNLTIDNGLVVSKAVIVTNCSVTFGAGAALEDAVIATTATGSKSMDAPSGVRFGKNDNCAKDGGAQAMTLGSISFASDLKMYGGQLVARHNISFQANANGIQGASMVAGGEISGTSNMSMGFCDTGMEDNIRVKYFRMVG